MRQPVTQAELKVISDQIHEFGHDFSLILANGTELLNFGTDRGTALSLMIAVIGEILGELKKEGHDDLVIQVKKALRDLL